MPPLLPPLLLLLLLAPPASSIHLGTNSNISQVYVDVQPANTSHHLATLRNLPISTYTLAYERGGKGRVRVGPLGPDLVSLIPEAVEVVSQKRLPPLEKGGPPVIIDNFFHVHTDVVFMYSVGAVQELSKTLDTFNADLTREVNQTTTLGAAIAALELLTSEASDGGAEIAMRDSQATAKQIKAELEIEINRAEEEMEYAELLKNQELSQLARNEELVNTRLAREDEASRVRASVVMDARIEMSRNVEEERASSEESLSEARHRRELEIQRMKEAMKMETARAEALAKAEAERMNEDVKLRMIKAEAEEARRRNVAAVKEAFTWLGRGFDSLMSNPKDVLIMIGYFAALALAVYVSRELANLCRVILESIIGKPTLIRETTKKNIFGETVDWFKDLVTAKLSNKQQNVYAEKVFEDVVLPDGLKKRVISLACSAAKARDYNAPHRHVLLYGPPGTGKTMVAKKLAECVGMDYAMCSGGDVGPLGSDGVTQIHNLFRWAKISRKGVLLFIDEAEAFLASRSNSGMSESAHNALNALLYNTGGERKDFMLVLATNRAEDLDAAVLDRCDESLFFDLPGKIEREVLLRLYFRKYVVEAADQVNRLMNRWWYRAWAQRKGTRMLEVGASAKGVGEWVKRAVDVCDGMSGRELAKIMIGVQAVMYGGEGVVTGGVVDGVINVKAQEHKEKRAMMKSKR